MARPLRLAFPGTLCHVTTRGNARQAIYRDDQGRQTFLFILEERNTLPVAMPCLLSDRQPLPSAAGDPAGKPLRRDAAAHGVYPGRDSAGTG
jgi:hypothetical protein